MNQDHGQNENPFPQQYDPYRGFEIPVSPNDRVQDFNVPPPRQSWWQNPLIVTMLLLAMAVLLASAVIVLNQPSLIVDGQSAPVIAADETSIKVEPTPEGRGGMQIANEDTQLFDEMVSQTDSLTQQSLLLAEQAVQQVETLLVEELEADVEQVIGAVSAEIESILVEEDTPSVEEDAPQKPTRLHPAGGSPETIAFVKNLLAEKKADAPEPQKDEVQDIVTKVVAQAAGVNPPVQEPVARRQDAQAQEQALAQALETSRTITNVQPNAIVPVPSPISPPVVRPKVQKSVSEPRAQMIGTHFVQLASIRDEAEAVGQWQNFQGQFGEALAGAGYRVQRADLGDKGTFFRIQAGPFDRAEAVRRCDAIKAVKPSGCYLVAR